MQDQVLELAEQVDRAAAAVAELDPTARQAAETLRAAVEAAHRDALVRIVRAMRSHPQAREVLFELVDDPQVHFLFSLHGIIRSDPAVEARRILDRIRPGLLAQGGDVELDRFEHGTAFLRYSGACLGGSMAALGLREDVERALAGELDCTIEVLREPAGHPSSGPPTRSGAGPGAGSGLTLIPLSAIRVRDRDDVEGAVGVTGGADTTAGADGGVAPADSPPTDEPGWVCTTPVAQVIDGAITPMRLVTTAGGEQDVIAVRIGDSIAVFRDRCAHQGLPLSDGLLDATAGTLSCRWHGYCYDATSGQCLSAPGVELDRLPISTHDGRLWIRAT